jgi:hypothetical protein
MMRRFLGYRVRLAVFALAAGVILLKPALLFGAPMGTRGDPTRSFLLSCTPVGEYFPSDDSGFEWEEEDYDH